MSPHLHQEIVRQRQNEIAARASRAHQQAELTTPDRPRVSFKTRLGQAIIAFGMSGAIAMGAVGVADASPAQSHPSVRVSASRLNRELRSLEARGYQQVACTTSGTRLHNPRTGRSVDVNW